MKALLVSDPASEIGWTVEERQPDAETARRAILFQHEKIRQLLSYARRIADAALDEMPTSPDSVASVIGDVRSAMEVHLTFEEHILLPLLEGDSSGGLPMADRLRDEHRQQRAMLAAIHGEACAHPQLPILAAKLALMAAWLLADMNHEEKALLMLSRK